VALTNCCGATLDEQDAIAPRITLTAGLCKRHFCDREESNTRLESYAEITITIQGREDEMALSQLHLW